MDLLRSDPFPFVSQTSNFSPLQMQEQRGLRLICSDLSPRARVLEHCPLINGINQAALESYWMSGLAEKLADVMSALGGKSVIKPIENQAALAGDYGYRYLVGVCRGDGNMYVYNTSI